VIERPAARKHALLHFGRSRIVDGTSARSAPHLLKSARLAAIDRSWPFGRSVSVNTQVSAWAAVSMPPRINMVANNFRFIAYLHPALPSRMGRGRLRDLG
jgi:hypothetical protein